MGRFTHDPRRSADVFYAGRDPFEQVTGGSILEFVQRRAGRRVLDFGCGTGGYAARLQQLGHDVVAVDANPAHVARAAALGVRAELADGALPYPDASVDTVMMIEVLEHLDDAAVESVLKEIRRVARGNVLITVPDCEDVPRLQPADLLPEHFLASDHVQFFTRETLEGLLRRFFPRVQVTRGDPMRPHLLLPPILRRPLSGLYRLGLLRTGLYSRLFAEARLDG